MQEENELQILQGVVEEVIYKNPDNGYIVIALDVDGAPETAVGTLGDIVEGETIKLRGNYIASAKYGRQFKAAICERGLPQTEAEITAYLGSGIIKGLGPAIAKRIVKEFGTEALDILDNDYMRLTAVKGITTDKALYNLLNK